MYFLMFRDDYMFGFWGWKLSRGMTSSFLGEGGSYHQDLSCEVLGSHRPQISSACFNALASTTLDLVKGLKMRPEGFALAVPMPCFKKHNASVDSQLSTNKLKPCDMPVCCLRPSEKAVTSENTVKVARGYLSPNLSWAKSRNASAP